MSADEVASQVSSELAAQVGYEPEEVTCPEDLPAEVGASIRCELTHEGTTLGVTVTASAVEGGQVDFDIQVDDQPAG
ncbi:uncharacterized protein DUF4333 [Allonocardiopsis opalescens]|uniref:Uncharacterized protein DUF4333 n=1 Tax=Allonocardiopsis opalescens TaxID=1144618 RepID=A0A2T0Q7U7_9ACTN|nr:uncharacterized protein DUF4333 [Allonocardiopsis opalescens]